MLQTVVATTVRQSADQLHDLEAKEERKQQQRAAAGKKQEEEEVADAGEGEEDTEDESLFEQLSVACQVLDNIFAVGAIGLPQPHQEGEAEEMEGASTDPIESNRIVKEVMEAGDFTSCLEQLRLLKASALLRRTDLCAHSNVCAVLAAYFGDEQELN